MAYVVYKGATVYFSENVYEPAEDSFLLADACIDYIRDNSRVLEIGTGSGFVSAVIRANKKNVDLIASDLNPHALNCAKNNNVEVIRSDLFGGFKPAHQFDTIVFNPPYLPTGDDERLQGWINFAFDGGEDGRDTIRRFLSEVNQYLKPNGNMLLLVSSLTNPKEVIRLMNNEDFNVSTICEDSCFFEKLMVLHGKLDS
ncbi:release factor glutamine methyltransferase [Methanohalophilus levihalophilus]|uniref:HemK2/MTQ2 family protein methyltransferase n=1 Tax=Methanohalophilus levihalophilus TaxID=1431282 RepID=UPI001AE39CEB|nr:HemK2/MTQ2 family protein methyltransferase [Methanohalophilus levihalophilus]MBP2029544.1 release factor glutamine methyltransferase [Methanohalophilus levihalophilus]